jgi:hypothetical protein
MHTLGVPPSAPSTSQNGSVGSVQEPSEHERGFEAVHEVIAHVRLNASSTLTIPITGG